MLYNNSSTPFYTHKDVFHSFFNRQTLVNPSDGQCRCDTLCDIIEVFLQTHVCLGQSSFKDQIKKILWLLHTGHSQRPVC